MRSRMAPQDEGFVLFDVDNIPISAILRSLFTQEGTLPERSVAGWGGGACAGGVPLRRPGRPPESGLAQRVLPRARRKRLSRLCAGQKTKSSLPGAVSLPALDYAGAVSESALRRDGEGRSPMDPLRVTGSVGRGVTPSGFAGGGFSSAPADRGNPARRTGWNTCPRDEGHSARKGWSDQRPGDRRGNLPPWDRWGNSPDADRTLRAGEQDGSAQNRRARSAGSSPSLI